MGKKKKLFFDMDGVLVDFQSGIDRLSDEVKKEYEGRLDEVPGIFSLMDPMPGAVEAVKVLRKYYDVYILSTAPWKNLSAWSDKVAWVTRHFGKIFHKHVILTHCKHLCKGDFLIDDRRKNGAGKFKGELIRFGTKRYPNWEKVVEYLLSPCNYLRPIIFVEDLNFDEITETMVEKTITALDSYAKILNEHLEENYTKELADQILSLSQLTNRWLRAKKIEDECQYYDI